MKKKAKRLFQKLLFDNFLVENSSVKQIKDIYLLRELLFYDELDIEKLEKEFKRLQKTYKFEIVDSKDPLVQLKASKSSIKYLFKDLLDEINNFTYEITVKVLLTKHKKNRDVDFVPVYFNSTTQTVINLNYNLEKPFHEIL